MSLIRPTPVADDNDDDIDFKLHRESGQAIARIRRAIRLFLFKEDAQGLDGFPRYVRRNVRVDKTDLLARQFDVYQQSPQLLDPHLEYIVSHLLHALGGVIRCSLHYPTTSDIDANVQPLPRAVCKLVYTLCKVRGAKVITRFFDNDTRYIGRLSGILETWKESLSWEERYVILLWLSHLALTPFDLDSLSTSSETIIPAPERTVISPDPLPLPEVAERLMSLARQYFSSVSKEREVATLLLVRLSLRPDMQRLCLHKHCIDWALLTLVQSGTESVNKSIHICISLLSFLAALFKSGDSMSVGQFVLPVLASLQKTLRNSNSSTKLLHESAIARKLFVKVECALASHLLSGSSFVDNQTDDLNQLMDHLLSLLQDKEGSVRLAASKALSVIAQRLDTDMRTQLLEEIIARYHESANLTLSEGHNAHPKTYLELHRHLASVDALQWHGLTLTLAHFLYRHCVPPKKLTAVINLVLCALDFEQRSATGKSTGANVRDAACFGLWSLARKYNTRELLRVASSQVRKRSTLFVHTSIFDIIAPDLLVRAGFDPDGNIRRAASAALQELVGRHPDLVPKGIELIQLVDYNSVGSRRQAIFQVVSLAAKLHHLYLCAICEGLFSWGGIYSPDLETRRVMAAYAGETVAQCPQPIIAPLQHHFESSHKRSVEEWHGLYLTLAAAVKFNPPTAIYGQFILSASLTISDLPYLLQENAGLSETDLVASNRSPEIAAEAVCCMIAASAYIIAGGSFQTWEDVSYHVRLLHASLGHCDKVPTYVYEQAALSILAAIDPDMKFGLVEEWLKNIDNGHGGRVQSGESNVGWITVVGVSLAAWIYVVPPMPYDSVLVKLLSKESDIDSKIAALRYLYGPVYNYCYGFSLNLEHLKQSLINSLDDYTVDSRGDIGSNVRIAALEIFGKLEVLNALAPDFKEILLGMISGLRLEKMDRVRDHASQCRRIQIKRSYDRVMGPAIEFRQQAILPTMSTSSVPYFMTVIKVANQYESRCSMIRGLITSAGYGNEVLVATARIALTRYLHSCPPMQATQFCCNLILIVRLDIPQGRLGRGGLELLAFILDSSPDGLIQSCQKALHELLPAMRNSTRSSDMRVLEALIKVCSALHRCELVVSGPAKVMLHQFMYHKFQPIRVQAAAALWASAPDERLRSMDLSLPASDMRAEVCKTFGYRSVNVSS